jgi:hypothetical protein
LYRPARAKAGGINSLESIPGLLKYLQIRAQATWASGIGSLELIPGLLKGLQIQGQATLDSRIVSLESIPGLLKRLQIQAQATIPWNRFLGSIKVLKIPPLFVLLRSSFFLASILPFSVIN